MQRRGRRGSGNVEDRRRIGGRDVAIGGMGGVAGIIVLLLITFMDGDPSSMLNTKPQRSSATPEQEDELKQSSSVVLADTEDVWRRQYRKIGRTYREPTPVLFSGYVQSACGAASSSTRSDTTSRSSSGSLRRHQRATRPAAIMACAPRAPIV